MDLAKGVECLLRGAGLDWLRVETVRGNYRWLLGLRQVVGYRGGDPVIAGQQGGLLALPGQAHEWVVGARGSRRRNRNLARRLLALFDDQSLVQQLAGLARLAQAAIKLRGLGKGAWVVGLQGQGFGQ
ncbi:hypothetical protein D3C80_1653330 [compost metagenome]